MKNLLYFLLGILSVVLFAYAYSAEQRCWNITNSEGQTCQICCIGDNCVRNCDG